MIRLFSFVGSLVVTRVMAGALDTAGRGAPGVDSMWSTIRSQFLSGMRPLDAVEYFTGRVTLFAFSIIGALGVGLIMYAGIKMMIGGEEGIADAKKIIQYALIGLALAMVSGVAIAFIASIAGSLLS